MVRPYIIVAILYRTVLREAIESDVLLMYGTLTLFNVIISKNDIARSPTLVG